MSRKRMALDDYLCVKNPQSFFCGWCGIVIETVDQEGTGRMYKLDLDAYDKDVWFFERELEPVAI